MSAEHEEDKSIRIDVYHHFDGPIEVQIMNAAGAAVSVNLAPQTPVDN